MAAKLRGARFAFWVMDLNPDEAIAAGWLREGSLTAKLLAKLSRFSLNSADRIIVLDRFMLERVLSTGVERNKLEVIPPWSHDAVVACDEAGRSAFRQRHGLEGKFVVMYAGNHSPCHPLDTLLETAQRLRGRSDIAFCFVGGGSEFSRVRKFADMHSLKSIKCIGYQPLEELSATLSAADLHAVVMGDPFVGIVHPCKIYNALAIGKPVLYIGPAQSHITDIFAELDRGEFASVAHGDVLRVEETIDRFSRNSLSSAARDGANITPRRSMNILLGRIVTVLESVHADRATLSVAPEPS
jgi:glycosyltransferase involved in cell wall biosynthesis